MKKLFQYPVALVFALAILLLSAFDILAPDQAYSQMENRPLAQSPSFSIKGLLEADQKAKFSTKYETYTNDQFLFRDQWISLKSLSERFLAKIENNGIAFGRNSQLFNITRTIDENRLSLSGEYIVDFAKKYPDAPITLSVVPYPSSILTSLLPAGLQNYNDLAATKHIYDTLGTAGIHSLDLAPVLSAAQGDYAFYRTDHHWTTHGAYLAYATIVQSWGDEPIAEDALPRTDIVDFYGTYYSKAKRAGLKADVLSYYTIPDLSVTIDGKPKEGLYDLTKLDERDKYAAFLYGNNGLTIIRRGAQKDTPSRLLVVKDSYANSLVPFLTQHYDEIYVVDLRSVSAISAVIADIAFERVLLLYGFDSLASDVNLAKLRY